MTDVFTVIVEMMYLLRCVGLFVSSSPLQSQKLVLVLYVKVILVSHVYATILGENINEIKEDLRVLMEYWVSLKN